MFARSAAPFALAAAFLLSACSDPGTADDGSIRGELDVYIANFDDGTSGNFYSLRTRDGQKLELEFETDPKLDPGDEIRVWGSQAAEKLQVKSFKKDVPNGGLGVVRAPLIDAPPETPRTFAFVLVTLNGVVPELTAAEAQERVVSGPQSFNGYYLETSYGIQPFDSEIFSGPDFAYTMSGCANGATGGMADDLRAAVDAAAGHSFDHYGYYFEGDNTGCNWSGLGQVGRPDRPAEDTWYRGSSGCVVLAQEVGHNLAQAHSSAIECGAASFAADPTTCEPLEYGDRFDVMGGGCYHWTMFHKVHWQWARECNSVRVTSTGTFDVFPLEQPCDGIQTLQIPMPSRQLPVDGNDPMPSDFYYVEYRQPVGNYSAPRGNLHNGVLIHAGMDYQPVNERGERPYLLDMTPGSEGDDRRDFEDAALTVGQTFTDPSGSPRITLTAADATKATLTIEVDNGTGNPTCLDGTELPAPGAIAMTCSDPPMPPVGTGGAGGSGGTGGVAGSAGTGGVVAGGSGGVPSGAGAGGASAGAPPAAGGSVASSGGAPTVAGGAPNLSGGAGPSAGAGPAAAIDPTDPAYQQVVGTCACRTPGNAGGSEQWGRDGLAALALLAFARRRRKT